MNVSEIMTINVEMCNVNDTISQVSKQMKQLNIGVLPVIENGQIVGVITDRDIIIRGVAQDRNTNQMTAGEAMTPNILSCSEDTDLETAARIMEENKVRRLFVEDSDGRLVGIVSLGDIAVHGDENLSGKILRDVSEPSAPSR